MSVLLVVGAYLLGSVSFSYWIVRHLVGEDIRTLGSGNAGATNVLRTTGKSAGLLTFVLDCAKGAIAVACVRLLTPSPSAIAFSALAVVLGHCYPVFHRFRGGKGVATSAGVAAVLAPLPLLAGLAVFVLIVWRTEFVAIGSIAACFATTFAAWLFGRLGWTAEAPSWLLATLLGIALMVVWTHRINLRRLIARTEARLSDDAKVTRRKP